MKAVKLITRTIDYVISVACFVLLIRWGHPVMAGLFLWLAVVLMYNYELDN